MIANLALKKRKTLNYSQKKLFLTTPTHYSLGITRGGPMRDRLGGKRMGGGGPLTIYGWMG
jgi:hypothetical protein